MNKQKSTNITPYKRPAYPGRPENRIPWDKRPRLIVIVSAGVSVNDLKELATRSALALGYPIISSRSEADHPVMTWASFFWFGQSRYPIEKKSSSKEKLKRARDMVIDNDYLLSIVNIDHPDKEIDEIVEMAKNFKLKVKEFTV